MKKLQGEESPQYSDFERFQDAVKQILSVSKEELEQRQIQDKERRQVKKPSDLKQN
jgi:hypothetical protein